MINVPIDLLKYSNLLKTKKEDGLSYIQDLIRKKWLVITPEEHVRQLFIHFLINDLGIRKARIAIERGFMINHVMKRFDIVVFDQEANPWLLIECKAPQVKISQNAFDQISVYNQHLKAPYLLVTNGLTNYICEMDINKNQYQFIQEIPKIDS